MGDQGEQNCHPCVMSFFPIHHFFVPHFAMAVFMCISYKYIKQRDTSFEFSSIVTFSVFFSFFGNRVWLNLYEQAFSGNETSIVTRSFYFYYEDVRVRLYSM